MIVSERGTSKPRGAAQICFALAPQPTIGSAPTRPATATSMQPERAAAVFVEQRALVVGGDEQQREDGDRVTTRPARRTFRSRAVSLRRGVLTRPVVPFERHAGQHSRRPGGRDLATWEKDRRRSLDACTWWRGPLDGRLSAMCHPGACPRLTKGTNEFVGSGGYGQHVVAADGGDVRRPDEHPGPDGPLRRRDAETLVGELDDDVVRRLRDRRRPLVSVRLQDGLRRADHTSPTAASSATSGASRARS